ncbi:2,3-bisphosphoglycerate-independent phosphoglycerate mutase [Gilvimarinus sp. F26214L]|uniref:2,3-bisphosphoglycerate-independent phosphoglycerate mutase n=1 Tax=Gilvimarinus sp. DZF01 TaxID=3461371 RepID=UPI004045F0A9
MTEAKRPLVLIVIDGFGYSAESKYNAIAAAKTPVWDALWQNGPKTLINTSGMAVGLPEGQMGNSEVGHMTLGAGRVVYQSYTRINKAIEDGSFATNPVYLDAIDKAASQGKAVHILGLLSPGGVHSHEDHLVAMIKLAAARKAQHIYLHAFLDGRDTPPRSAAASLQKAEEAFAEAGHGRIASITGRFYAMDRDNRWDRVQAAYDLLVDGKADYRADSAGQGLAAGYDRGENDEFLKPTAIAGSDDREATVQDGDAVIFMNFRPDRARQLTRAFTEKGFAEFPARQPQLAAFVQTTEYSADIDAPVAFPPQDLANSMGEYLARNGKTQLRIAETEKYAHVTFFFSGGQEELYEGEDRILVPSPKVATYDLQPEMSAPEVTDKLVAAIESRKYDTIICNYANCDQVGHTGIFEAAVQAVEAVDQSLDRVLTAISAVGGEALITADHGNVEVMFDDASGQAMTQHTTLPVPLVYAGERELSLAEGGSLADIAPTMLALMGLPQPAEMTGRNLASFDN